MLHLAQVEKIEPPDTAGLRLLARQRSEHAWALLSDQEVLPFESAQEYGVGAFVLVKLSETRQVVEVEDAREWLLDIIQTFLKSGVTPAFLQEESDRAEQWRQTLTLQSQDLDRRALELEARREQIEQLEETLKRDKKQMESLAVQYKEQNQELDRRASELELRYQQIEQLEENLKRDRKQLDELLIQHKIQVNPAG